MAKTDDDTTPRASGVNELIARLHQEGVEAGEAQARTILEKAKAEAAAIRRQALAEAKNVREAARRDAEAYRQAGEDALQAAIRDAMLALKTQMSERFGAEMRRLVSSQMRDPEFLRRMILELVGRTRDTVGAAEAVEVILPLEVTGFEEFRDRIDELEDTPLTDFVRGVTGDLIREGVTFTWSDDVAAGARVYIEGDDVTVDLSDAAVADMLARYLQPRFRAILEGVVK